MKMVMKNLLCLLLSVFLIAVTNGLDQEDIGEYLDTVGKSLKRKLSRPGEGHDTILRDLYDYYNHLEEIYANVTSKDDKVMKEGLDIVQELIEDGGPPHLNIEVDFDEFLFKIYKNDKDVQAIYNVLKENRKTWSKLKALYEKHAQI